MSDGPQGLKIERAMQQTGLSDTQKALKKVEQQKQAKPAAQKPAPNLPMPENYSQKSSASNMLSIITNPTSNNANRDYSQKAKVIEAVDSAKADLGNGPGTQAGDEVEVYMTATGKRGIKGVGNSVPFYETEPGSGVFTAFGQKGRNMGMITLAAIDDTQEEDKGNTDGGSGESGGSGVSGGSGGNSGDRTPSYGTEFPEVGDTGSVELDINTTDLQDKVDEYEEKIDEISSRDPETEIEKISKPAKGLEATVLTNNPESKAKNKKKKSYLTPVS